MILLNSEKQCTVYIHCTCIEGGGGGGGWWEGGGGGWWEGGRRKLGGRR